MFWVIYEWFYIFCSGDWNGIICLSVFGVFFIGKLVSGFVVFWYFFVSLVSVVWNCLCLMILLDGLKLVCRILGIYL